jgi:acyl dehydratase
VPRFDEVAVGDELPVLSAPIGRADLVRYAGACGDFNPIHWDERFAREVGLPDVVAHGMLTMAIAARLVTKWAGDPGAVVDYGVRFTHPVVVPAGDGALLEVTGKIKDKRAGNTVLVDLTARSAGHKVLGKATATVRLP